MNPLDFLHSEHVVVVGGGGLHLGYYSYWYSEAEVRPRVFFAHNAVVSDGQTDVH